MVLHRVRRKDSLMCCDEPCLVSVWEDGKYVLKCINCEAMK